MATTGFWPIKGRLKDAIDYAENPDKTTDRKYLDEDLYSALRYAANDEKTDKKMYVSAINCPKQLAYETMMDTKRRYGKLGENVAYHGYQSFKTGEVTPQEAHTIGMETARRMWGDDYEIVVTTHLNTDNIHNHIVGAPIGGRVNPPASGRREVSCLWSTANLDGETQRGQ